MINNKNSTSEGNDSLKRLFNRFYKSDSILVDEDLESIIDNLEYFNWDVDLLCLAFWLDQKNFSGNDAYYQDEMTKLVHEKRKALLTPELSDQEKIIKLNTLLNQWLERGMCAPEVDAVDLEKFNEFVLES